LQRLRRSRGRDPQAGFFDFFYRSDPQREHAAAYYRAIEQFLAWIGRVAFQGFEDIEPITVAACIEASQHQAPPATEAFGPAKDHTVYEAASKLTPLTTLRGAIRHLTYTVVLGKKLV
jgi:hypothetical protein